MRKLYFEVTESEQYTGIALLITKTVNCATLLGFVITAMIALTVCCEGFGRLLNYQETLLQSVRSTSFDVLYIFI